MRSLPSISIVSPTYNCDLNIFKQSLESIKMQDYPKKLIEQVRVDGGSKNRTINLAKSYGARVIERPDLLEASQERMGIAFLEAKNEIILILESDNILIGKNWLRLMVQPFIENKDIFCTFSMYNGFKKNMPVLTRYLALFGTNDIFLYYLGKVEKMPLDERGKYNKGEIIDEKPFYYIVRFNSKNLPPMGDNGFMIRRNILSKVAQNSRPFIHVDAWAHLIKEGHNTFGVVKNSIIHYSGGSIIKQYRNRVLIKQKFYDNKQSKRIYLTFDPHSVREIWSLIKFILITVTFVIPLIRSIKGYIKVKDLAWFLHPIACLVALFMYTKSEFSLLTYFYDKKS